MNKNKLFVIISIVSFLTIFVSLISMMILTPSTKKNTFLYKGKNQATNMPIEISTDFILKTISNKAFNSKTLRDQFILIYFGSTYCPHTCLPNLIKMKSISTLLEKQYNSDPIKFIFITADPKKDTSEHLNKYFQKLNAQIIPLTGTESEIELVLKNFQAYKILFSNRNTMELKESKTLQPTCILSTPAPFYLIDKHGEFIKNYNLHSASLNIAKDISHYMKVS